MQWHDDNLSSLGDFKILLHHKTWKESATETLPIFSLTNSRVRKKKSSQKKSFKFSFGISLGTEVFPLCCFFIFHRINSQNVNIRPRVSNLVVTADFRSVNLQFRYNSVPEPIGFYLTLCDVSTFLRSGDNCFERHLLSGKRNVLLGHDSLTSEDRGWFEAILYDLRMSTNYTVEVEPMENMNFLQASSARHRIGSYITSAKKYFLTKGFSAHATNCLANSSDIVVHTGPYFGGMVSVEGSADQRCSIYGNRTSGQEVYVLRIDHKFCGSKTVNGTRIDTVVVVHESSSVVTHNSRKFLVQCTFLPETFTIKASFSVPPAEENKRNLNFKQLEDALKTMDSNDVFTYEHYKQNNVKDSRMSSIQGPSVMQKNLPGYESHMLSLLVMVIVIVIVAVLVIGLGLWWYVSSQRRRCNNVDIETMSTSGSSIMAYHHGGHADDDDILVRQPTATGFLSDPYDYYHTRNMNPFCAGQVALVSLKPVKELY